MSKRLLQSKDIPDTLWQPDEELLALANALCNAYRQELTDQGLLDTCFNFRHEDGPVGGMDTESSRRHFATRFSGSCGRIQLALLDPLDELKGISDLFLKAFAGGRVGLLDIPCGAGASSVTLLTCLQKLREQGVVPRTCLEIFILGGDISDHARMRAGALLDDLAPKLEEQAIYLKHDMRTWDVRHARSTTRLLADWLDFARDCREYFVIAANFSGFLGSSGNFKAARPQMGEILRWAEARRSSVAWLEPQTNASSSLWDRVKGFLASFFSPSVDGGQLFPIAKSKVTVQHPIKDSKFTCRLSIMKLEHMDPE